MATLGNAVLAPWLSTSVRTLGAEVVRGRWSRSLVADSLSEPFPVDGVAVFVCCTVPSLAVMRSGKHDPLLIRDARPRPLRAATQVGRPISLSASGREDP